MRIKFICAAVTRACVILCLMAVVAAPNPAKAMTRHKVAGSDACTFYRGDNNSTTYRYTDTANFNIKIYDPSPGRRHGIYIEEMLRMQKITPDCPTVQKKVEEFFRIAIQRNEKNCAKLKWSGCAEYNNWAQNLYEAAVKNGNKSFASTIKKYSSYVRNDTKAKEAAAALAKEKARKAAEKEKARKEAAKKKAAEEKVDFTNKIQMDINRTIPTPSLKIMSTQRNGVATLRAPDELVAKSAIGGFSVSHKTKFGDGAWGQQKNKNINAGIIEYTFVPLTNKKIGTATNGILLKKEIIGWDITQIGIEKGEYGKTENGLLSLKVREINTVKLQPKYNIFENLKPMIDVHTDSRYFPENIDYEKQAAEHASRVARSKALEEKYKLLNEKWDEERLKNEVLAEAPLYGKRMVLEYIIETNPKKMKTINSRGMKRTIYASNAAKQGLTLGSPIYKKNLSGIDMGIPLVIYDLVNEVCNYAYSIECPFKRREMLGLASKSYEDLVKIIDDPNINKAIKMTAEQLKQIEAQQRKTQAGSKDNSGGSTAGGVAADGAAEGGSVEGHDHDHDHEEEDWRTAPGSIYYD